MTLDELKAWLADGVASDPDAVDRARELVAQADAGSSGALRVIEDLRVREVLIVKKFDKTDVWTPGCDGLEPMETVIAEFENGRRVASTVVSG